MNKLNLLIFWIIFSSIVFAQKTNDYQGAYTLFNLKGNAQYSYYTLAKDTVKHKEFNFIYHYISSDSNPSVHQINVKGNYQNGLKNKTWIINHSNLQKSGEAFINSNGWISYPSTGIEHKIIAEFNNGLPEGNWLVSRNYVENAAVKDSIFLVKTIVNAGQIQQYFYGKDSIANIQLEINKSGN